MTIASIDFSINSTCVCIDLGSEYVWHHFTRDGIKQFDVESESFIVHKFPRRETGENYCSTERMKVLDAQQLCSSITSILKDMNVRAVAFEGHSFNSKGNSLMELVSYQFLLRNMLVNELSIDIDRFFFYSPVTIKSFAGGARFKKIDMLNVFLSSTDRVLIENQTFVKMKLQKDLLIKGENVVKPIDDLVDSYWILKKLQQDV